MIESTMLTKLESTHSKERIYSSKKQFDTIYFQQPFNCLNEALHGTSVYSYYTEQLIRAVVRVVGCSELHCAGCITSSGMINRNDDVDFFSNSANML